MPDITAGMGFQKDYIGISKISAYGGLCGYPHNPPPEPIEAFDLGSREGSIREIRNDILIDVIRNFKSKDPIYPYIKAVFFRDVLSKEPPHIYVFCTDEEISIMFNGMRKNVKRVKSSVCNENWDSVRKVAAVDHLCKGEKFILFSNGLYSTIGKPPGEQVKERYQMNLIIAICGFPIRREISFRILGVSGKICFGMF